MIAAVNGLAFGGGTEIAASANIIVAATHATFALPEVRVGVFMRLRRPYSPATPDSVSSRCGRRADRRAVQRRGCAALGIREPRWSRRRTCSPPPVKSPTRSAPTHRWPYRPASVCSTVLATARSSTSAKTCADQLRAKPKADTGVRGRQGGPGRSPSAGRRAGMGVDQAARCHHERTA